MEAWELSDGRLWDAGNMSVREKCDFSSNSPSFVSSFLLTDSAGLQLLENTKSVSGHPVPVDILAYYPIWVFGPG